MLKRISIFFLTWKAIVLLFTFIAPLFLPLKYTSLTFIEFRKILPYLVWIWGNFDGTHYVSIAREGYFNLENPFFPLYPFLIHVFTSTQEKNYLLSALFISNIFFLLSLPLVYELLLLDKKRKLVSLALSIIIFFPTSFFYGAAYNDSLFFFLACLTIYFSRKHFFLLSCISAALATLTRLNGLALSFLIIFEYIFFIEQKVFYGISLNKIKKFTQKLFSIEAILETKIYSIFLIPFAFLGYLLYTHLVYGNWQLVFSSMKVWNQDSITFPLQVIFRYIKILFLYRPFDIIYFVALIEFLFVLLYIFLLFYSYKKIRFSYWIFFFISIIIPSLTGTFQGMPRYGLHVYPFFLSLSLFMYNKSIVVKSIYFFISIALMVIGIILFTRGYFIS